MKPILFTATIDEKKTQVEIKFDSQLILETAQGNGIVSGSGLAYASRIAAPNYYENMNGQTFPAIPTICKLLSGAGLTLEEIKNTRLGDVLSFEPVETPAQEPETELEPVLES